MSGFGDCHCGGIEAVALLLYDVCKGFCETGGLVTATVLTAFTALSLDRILVSSQLYACYVKPPPLLTHQAPTNPWGATMSSYGICVDTLNVGRYGKVYTPYKRKSTITCRRA